MRLFCSDVMNTIGASGAGMARKDRVVYMIEESAEPSEESPYVRTGAAPMSVRMSPSSVTRTSSSVEGTSLPLNGPQLMESSRPPLGTLLTDAMNG
jgi:hypothetical protein